MPEALTRKIQDAKAASSNGGPPEAAPDTSELLAETVAFLRRFVVFANSSQALALALWVLHTFAFDAADVTPYPIITGPERRCGKTLVLDVLSLLVRSPWRIDGAPSEAVLFRTIEARQPTVLLDEVDVYFATGGERTEHMRALLNAGNRRGATVPRCVGPNFDVRDFNIFAPKLLAGIDASTWPDTIRDRGIVIGLRRKLATESVERFRRREVEDLAEAFRGRCESWATEERIEALRLARPSLPPELHDRAADAWEPLLALADDANGDYSEQAREAAQVLSGGSGDVTQESVGVRLLADVGTVFKGDRMTTEALSTALASLEESPWAETPPSPRRLADLLRPYGVRPKVMRMGESTRRGYVREDLLDPLARYVGGEWSHRRSATSQSAATPQHPSVHGGSQAKHDAQPSPHSKIDVSDVTGVTPDSRGGHRPRPNPSTKPKKKDVAT